MVDELLDLLLRKSRKCCFQGVREDLVASGPKNCVGEDEDGGGCYRGGRDEGGGGRPGCGQLHGLVEPVKDSGRCTRDVVEVKEEE